jgi:hypothetical protein
VTFPSEPPKSDPPTPSPEPAAEVESAPAPPPPVNPEPRGGPTTPGPGPQPGPAFTSGEKVGALLEVVFDNPNPPADARTRAALRAIATARRFRLLKPLADVFPPLEDSEAWDAWIALALGVCLNLVSDGVDVDVDEARRHGATVLGQLFAERGPD